MILARAFFAAFLLLVPSLAIAAPQCKANGCGPDGFIGRLVPNHFFHECEFKNCCDSHDVCYGRCLGCGDLHGSPACDDPAKRAARKAVCDDALYNDINRVNANKILCKGFAYAYWSAVSLAGGGFFHGIVVTAAAEAKFRTDFDAALAYYQFESQRGRTSEIDQSRSAIKLLSQLDGIENNALAFRAAEDRGVLAVESQTARSIPRFELRDARAVEQKKFLNNVDVTKMEYGGQTFDLGRALRDVTEPGIDVRALQQREEFIPVQ